MIEPGGDPALEGLFAYRRRQNDFRLAPDASALLLVDLQYGSASPDHGFNAIYRDIGFGDVVDGYVSVEAARRIYGVTIRQNRQGRVLLPEDFDIQENA